MLHLKPMEADDCQQVVDWNAGQDADFLCQWAGPKVYTFPLTVEQIVERMTEAGTRIFAILDDTAMVGTVELSPINREQGSAIICRFLIGQERRGKGYGQKALQLLTDLAFHDLHLSRLELRVFVYNVAAIRCYQKAGFLVCQYHENRNNPKRNGYTMAIELGK